MSDDAPRPEARSLGDMDESYESDVSIFMLITFLTARHIGVDRTHHLSNVGCPIRSTVRLVEMTYCN